MQVVTDRRKPNRLAHEKSPYLLQHAYNPVDWYPWGEEAFEKARREDKPIFLSIGYSTCHWCHVMERESFEDEGIARYLNEHFVCIKVDREERPDVDQIYIDAAIAMQVNPGWPLSMFLTADRKPFRAGTYFPPEDRFGRPGFMSVLEEVHEAWTGSREQLLVRAGAVAGRLDRIP
ncbi:MAG TPA: thioredoxin domain-containing protein, partial [Candidatus Eisenbacteria bacterium]|nr:thioredoxin domain-containing protein [Candidatus Eisenbacteria bacterium]